MAEAVTTVIESWDIVKIALGSGATAALVGGGLQWIRDLHGKKRDEYRSAKIEAVQLITKLDLLAMNCARVYWQFNEEMDDYKARAWGSNEYPSCQRPCSGIGPLELTQVDQEIAARIAWLDNEFKLGSQMIAMKLGDNVFPPDVEDALADLVGHYGFQAMKIAETLRKKYSIGNEELVLKMRGRVVSATLESASNKVRNFLVVVD
ncbi:hypothetical protein QLG14_24425 [Pseudomonas sp. V104_10]|jgi:hypothetical protein|uniref:hypothetical protein n=1 Tax=Pseudomonas sp. V104_10 TaxID=3044231 RepID=UPI00249DAFF6|nr:hypothetical protein [Pseudomonas sp. V104_10]MDI3372376.1 hypothetical protein [Pseudomonas sp. V104_10]